VTLRADKTKSPEPVAAGVAGYLPANETDLSRSQPPSNRPGSFPATALLGQEKVIYETRPTLMGQHPVLVIAPLPLIVLFALVGVVGVVEMGWQPDLIGGLGFVEFIFFVPIIYALVSWRQTSYALTDQRVLKRSGESFETATYDDVQGVTMTPKSSKLVFELTPLAPGAASGLFGGRGRKIVWTAVPGAPAVVSFAQSAAMFYRVRNRQRQLRQDFVVASMSDRIVCAFCGGLLDVATLNPENPRCPRCSAPISVASAGG
jgi:hypothetical protein